MARSKQVTVTSSAATTTLTGPLKAWQGVEVVNLDGAGIVSVKIEGTASAGGDDCDFVPAAPGAGMVLDIPPDADGDGNIDISLVATVTSEVAVRLVRGEDAGK